MRPREARASTPPSERLPDPRTIRKKRIEGLSGKRNRQCYLWDVLTFQAWLEEAR